MDEKRQIRFMLYFTLLYLVIFSVNSLIKRNYEFLYYSVIVFTLLIVTVLYYQKIQLNIHILLGLTILGALHIFGGNVHLFGTRIYDLWLIPHVFRYDNLVHCVGSFVGVFIVYNFLRPHLDKKVEHNFLLLSVILILMVMGIGAFNELLELLGVVVLGVAKEVGDYMNNALDLLFNLLGSVVACLVLTHNQKKKRKIR